MSNPMLTALTQNRTMQNISRVKQIMQTVKSAGNPQMMLNQMIGQNPQFKQVMDYVNANGGDPKVAFYKMAQEKGVNPDDILNQLRM